MFFLILFLIENIIISRFLNKKNMKVASIAHLVFFIFLSMYLFFPPYSNFSEFKEIFIKEDIYTIISEVINEPNDISYFTISISSLVSLTMLLMLIISAALVGVCIINKYFKFFIIKNSDIKEEETYYCSYKRAHINKIYKLYCSWRN